MKQSMTVRWLSILLALGLAGTSQADLISSISADRTGANPGDQLSINIDLPDTAGNSVYLAAAVGGGLFFFDENGNPSAYQAGKPTPRRFASAGKGRQNALTMTVPDGVSTDITFYSVLGKGGSDILGAPANIAPSSLSAVKLKLTNIAGGPAYAANCQSCHEFDPYTNVHNIQAGKDAAVIKRAIASDKGGMGSLSYLKPAEIDAISFWIQSPRFDCH